MQITVTNFGVGASPAAATVAAGQTATYAVDRLGAGRRLQQRRDALVRQPAAADLLRVLAGGRHARRTGTATSVLTVTTTSGASASPRSAAPRVAPCVPAP